MQVARVDLTGFQLGMKTSESLLLLDHIQELTALRQVPGYTTSTLGDHYSIYEEKASKQGAAHCCQDRKLETQNCLHGLPSTA